MSDIWDTPDGVDRLRRSATAAALLVLWIVIVGVGWRQVESRADANTRSVVDATAAGTRHLDVGLSATVTEIQETLVDLDIDPDRHFTRLVADPTSLRLPPELAGAETLHGLLAAGRYPITPTTDASVLLERMTRAFVDEVDPATMLGLERRGTHLATAARRAVVVEAMSTATAHYPVAATLVTPEDVAAETDVATIDPDALAAVTAPVSLSAEAVGLGPEGPFIRPYESPTAIVDELQRRSSTALAGVDGRTSFVVAEIGGAVLAADGADRVMESASIYKLAVLAVAMHEVDHGRLSLSGSVAAQLDPTRLTGPIAVDDDLTVREAMRRMTVVSDNPSAEALLFGLGPDMINQRLRSWGIDGFNVGSRPQVVTASGVAALLEVIVTGRHHEAESTAFMMGLLAETPQDSGLAFAVDRLVRHKTGDLDDVMNDAGLLRFGARTYAVVVLTDSLADRDGSSEAIPEFGRVVVDLLAAQQGDRTLAAVDEPQWWRATNPR